jgi:hypothetical protein
MTKDEVIDLEETESKINIQRADNEANFNLKSHSRPVMENRNLGVGSLTPEEMNAAEQHNANSRPGLNKSYLKLNKGYIRLALIIFLTASWIAAAAAFNNNLSQNDDHANAVSTRGAYLFFTVTAFVASIAIFLLNILNIVNLNRLHKIPFGIIVNIFFIKSL